MQEKERYDNPKKYIVIEVSLVNIHPMTEYSKMKERDDLTMKNGWKEGRLTIISNMSRTYFLQKERKKNENQCITQSVDVLESTVAESSSFGSVNRDPKIKLNNHMYFIFNDHNHSLNGRVPSL